MNALLPNTNYKLVPVLLAIPAEIDNAGIFDGLNDMLRSNCGPAFIADWAFPVQDSFAEKSTSSDQEEGELFMSDAAEPLKSALVEAYEAMLAMRGMLSRADVSTQGGSIDATINRTALLLFPPSDEAIAKAKA